MASSKASVTPGGGPSNFERVARWIRGISLVVGLGVSSLGAAALLGLLVESFSLRLIVALVVLVALPAVVADKALGRTKGVKDDKLSIVIDVFAAFWLVLSLVFVGVAQSLYVKEGDRETRAGSLWLARTAYFLGGVSPTFRTEHVSAPGASSVPSAGPSGVPSAGPSTSASATENK